jgi:putative transposase
MGELGLQGKFYCEKKRAPNSNPPFHRYPNLVQHLEVVRPDQLWVRDINYIKLRWEFVYLAVLVDVFTRCIRGWDPKRSLSQELTQLTSQKVLVQHTVYMLRASLFSADSLHVWCFLDSLVILRHWCFSFSSAYP